MKIVKTLLLVTLTLTLCGAALLYMAGAGLFGDSEDAGRVSAIPIPPDVLRKQQADQRAVAPAAAGGNDRRAIDAGSRILFGDFHVHTTFSGDAFITSLALMGGEGSRPPADACDFARYCSALDFWSINDHAEQLTPRRWRETIDSIRACNAVNADPAHPDTVAFLGWEWTQMGDSPENHYGHRNVILRGLDDNDITTRPISARPPPSREGDFAAIPAIGTALNLLFERTRHGLNAGRYFRETAKAREHPCPLDTPVRDMPADCMESAATPAELFAKLDDWGIDSLVIPHGTTWGNYTPPGSSWEKQLGPVGHDPNRQFLMEVYSGHGSAEVYRPWRAVTRGEDGEPECPPPGPGYLPSCWRAGEIIRERCLASGEGDNVCAARAKETRELYTQRGNAGFHVVPGAAVEDWLDAGQCSDCFLPAFNYRPLGSLQYMLALGKFDTPGPVQRFRFGVIGSSDNHSARAGTGYKEIYRHAMTDATGFIDVGLDWSNNRPRLAGGPPPAPPAFPDPVDTSMLATFDRAERDRINSFFTSGGLVAVHAPGRTRDAIWSAVGRRQVYGTSGDRILLWFDAQHDGASYPMGSALNAASSPRFHVKAVGDWEQQPGCPQHSRDGLSPERLASLCLDECYNPSEQRKVIERIEIVKITPQREANEPVAGLIHDPWLVHDCPPDPTGCSFSFSDDAYAAGERDAVYYVRAIEAASDALNGANLRCEYDAQGVCVAVDPCYGSEVFTDPADDCLAPVNERAWSSPIFVDYGASTSRSRDPGTPHNNQDEQ